MHDFRIEFVLGAKHSGRRLSLAACSNAVVIGGRRVVQPIGGRHMIFKSKTRPGFGLRTNEMAHPHIYEPTAINYFLLFVGS